MLSAFHQRSGYTAAQAMDPLSMSAISLSESSSSQEDQCSMTKPMSYTDTHTTTMASPQHHDNNNHTAAAAAASTTTRISIDDRLRSVMGDMLTEEELQTKFTFGRMLGSGATSKVYAAMDNATGREVSVKVFDKASMIEVRRSMVADGDFVQEKAIHRVRRRLLKVLSELEISRALDHPNIIKYLGAYETSHRLCIVHELVDGCDLLEYLLTHGKMDETLAAGVFRQVLLALQYCHERHIYHRDLKLENVLITKDYKVKLIDFGLSEIVPPGETLKTICGTPLYCSPEVLFMHSSTREKGFYGGPADVWSVGILIFALLTGCAPFDDSNFTKLRTDVHRNRIAYPGYLSNTVKGLLKLVLIFDPTLRPTVSDILHYEWIQNASATDELETSEPVTESESVPSSPTATASAVWTPSSKNTKDRSWSDATATTTASTSGSFEDGEAHDLRKITEEPHEPEIALPTHLSCLERELEQLMTVS